MLQKKGKKERIQQISDFYTQVYRLSTVNKNSICKIYIFQIRLYVIYLNDRNLNFCTSSAFFFLKMESLSTFFLKNLGLLN